MKKAASISRAIAPATTAPVAETAVRMAAKAKTAVLSEEGIGVFTLSLDNEARLNHQRAILGVKDRVLRPVCGRNVQAVGHLDQVSFNLHGVGVTTEP